MSLKLLLLALVWSGVLSQACYKYKCQSLKDKIQTFIDDGKQQKVAFCFLHEKENESLLFVDSKICLDGTPFHSP